MTIDTGEAPNTAAHDLADGDLVELFSGDWTIDQPFIFETTIEELAVVADALGLELPVLPDLEELDELGDDALDAALSAALRSLVARGIVDLAPDGDAEVATPYAAMVQVLAGAQFGAEITVSGNDVATEAIVAGADDVGVLYRAGSVAGVAQLVLFPGRDIAWRLIEECAIEPALADDLPPLVFTNDELDAVLDGVERGERDQLVERFPAADSLLDTAFDADARWGSVEVTAWDGQSLVSATHGWLQAGDALWLVDVAEDAMSADGEPTEFVITSVGDDELVARIFGAPDSGTLE